MMRNLFNNKWFIVALAVGSVLLMSRSILVEVWNTPDFSDTADVDPYDGMDMEADDGTDFDELGNVAGEFLAQLTTAQSDINANSSRTVHHRRLTWSDEPRRDPFKAQMAAELPLLSSLSSADTTAPVASGPPRLEALVAGPESSFAVFGDRVVTEGDRVDGYRIVRITPEGVRVASNQGSRWLPPPGSTNSRE